MMKGWELAKEGMEAAADHAEREHEGWKMMAYALFLRYAAATREPFMTEQVRWYAEGLGLEPPPDKRAWGAIAVKAKKAGYVRSIGYAPQKADNAHGAPKTLWKSL